MIRLLPILIYFFACNLSHAESVVIGGKNYSVNYESNFSDNDLETTVRILLKNDRIYDAENLIINSLNGVELRNALSANFLIFMMNSLGVIYKETGRFKLSEDIFMQALKLSESNFGKHHAYTVGINLNLSLLDVSLGNGEKAIKRLENNKDNLLHHSLENSTAYLKALSDLGNEFHIRNEYNDAIAVYEILFRDVNKDNNLFNLDYSFLGRTMYSYAAALQNRGRCDEAIDMYQDTRDLTEGNLPENLFIYHSSIFQSGRCLFQYKSYDFIRYQEYFYKYINIIDKIVYRNWLSEEILAKNKAEGYYYLVESLLIDGRSVDALNALEEARPLFEKYQLTGYKKWHYYRYNQLNPK